MQNYLNVSIIIPVYNSEKTIKNTLNKIINEASKLISKIKRELKWKPQIKIENGVKDLLNKINYWKSAPVWTPKSIERATKIWFKLLTKK